MTPIKLGDHAVFATKDGRYVVCKLAKEGDRSPLFAGLVVSPDVNVYLDKSVHATLPMALRVAAEAAGIERQRVEVYRYPPFIGGYGTALVTYSVNGLDYFETFDRNDIDEQNECGEMAHEYARERYAALGGAA